MKILVWYRGKRKNKSGHTFGPSVEIADGNDYSKCGYTLHIQGKWNTQRIGRPKGKPKG
jgi:hypothetical protein